MNEASIAVTGDTISVRCENGGNAWASGTWEIPNRSPE
jgi:hypothetical protein